MPIGGYLLNLFVMPNAHASRQCVRPSAIDIAAAVTVCITESPSYPPGAAVVAACATYESTLSKDGEHVAWVGQKVGTVELSTIPLDVEAPARGDGWKRERHRYALACSDREVARLIG